MAGASWAGQVAARNPGSWPSASGLPCGRLGWTCIHVLRIVLRRPAPPGLCQGDAPVVLGPCPARCGPLRAGAFLHAIGPRAALARRDWGYLVWAPVQLASLAVAGARILLAGGCAEAVERRWVVFTQKCMHSWGCSAARHMHGALWRGRAVAGRPRSRVAPWPPWRT